MGLFPEHVLPLLNKIKKSDKLIAFDIAEYNPKYDRDDQTAHLAADLIAYLTN